MNCHAIKEVSHQSLIWSYLKIIVALRKAQFGLDGGIQYRRILVLFLVTSAKRILSPDILGGGKIIPLN